jgi:hypothetical protein
VRRAGTVFAGAGAVGLAIAAALRWFALDLAKECGWTCYSPLTPETRQYLFRLRHLPHGLHSLGPAGATALGALVLIGLLAVAASLRVPASRRATLLSGLAVAGAIALGGLLERTLIAQPELGLGASDAQVALKPAAWIGLALAALTALGVALLWLDARRTARSTALS